MGKKFASCHYRPGRFVALADQKLRLKIFWPRQIVEFRCCWANKKNPLRGKDERQMKWMFCNIKSAVEKVHKYVRTKGLGLRLKSRRMKSREQQLVSARWGETERERQRRSSKQASEQRWFSECVVAAVGDSFANCCFLRSKPCHLL